MLNLFVDGKLELREEYWDEPIIVTSKQDVQEYKKELSKYKLLQRKATILRDQYINEGLDRVFNRMTIAEANAIKKHAEIVELFERLCRKYKNEKGGR